MLRTDLLSLYLYYQLIYILIMKDQPMKTNKWLLTLPVLALPFYACNNKQAQSDEQTGKKPMNILYIMSDDHSYQTISAYDTRFIQTPNIDRIAYVSPTVLWQILSVVLAGHVC